MALLLGSAGGRKPQLVSYSLPSTRIRRRTRRPALSPVLSAAAGTGSPCARVLVATGGCTRSRVARPPQAPRSARPPGGILSLSTAPGTAISGELCTRTPLRSCVFWPSVVLLACALSVRARAMHSLGSVPVSRALSLSRLAGDWGTPRPAPISYSAPDFVPGSLSCSGWWARGSFFLRLIPFLLVLTAGLSPVRDLVRRSVGRWALVTRCSSTGSC